jgi:putative FmdB family regulatory protein
VPTYEYKCSNCNYVFEVFQTIKAEPLKECPKCGGEVKRLIGAGAGPIFKGSGFYHTDYKAKPQESKSSTPKTQAKKDGENKTPKQTKDE